MRFNYKNVQILISTILVSFVIINIFSLFNNRKTSNSVLVKSYLTYNQENKVNNKNELVTPQANWKVGKYFCRISWERGYVGGCIKKNLKHLNLHIRNTKTNADIINLHLSVWWKNGPQFGAYNSATKWCSNTTGTYSKIRNTIKNALLAVKIPYWAAYPIAVTTAIIVVVSFGLAWI